MDTDTVCHFWWWCDFCSEFLAFFSELGTPEKISVTVAQYSPARSMKSLPPSGVLLWLQAVLTTQVPWFHWEAGSNHQKALHQMWWGWFQLSDGSMWVKGNPLNSKTPYPGELQYNRKLRTTLPVFIKPPHNSEAITASLQIRQDYSRHDVHAK